jgi:hypothetical protein
VVDPYVYGGRQLKHPGEWVADIGQQCNRFGESGDRLGDAPVGDQRRVGIDKRDVVMVLGSIDPTPDRRQTFLPRCRIMLGE